MFHLSHNDRRRPRSFFPFMLNASKETCVIGIAKRRHGARALSDVGCETQIAKMQRNGCSREADVPNSCSYLS